MGNGDLVDKTCLGQVGHGQSDAGAVDGAAIHKSSYDCTCLPWAQLPSALHPTRCGKAGLMLEGRVRSLAPVSSHCTFKPWFFESFGNLPARLPSRRRHFLGLKKPRSSPVDRSNERVPT